MKEICSGRNLAARKQESKKASKKSTIINGQGGLHRKEAYIAYLAKQTKIQSNRMNGWIVYNNNNNIKILAKIGFS